MMSFYKSVIAVHKFDGIREILLKKKAKKKRNPKKSHSHTQNIPFCNASFYKIFFLICLFYLFLRKLKEGILPLNSNHTSTSFAVTLLAQ